MECNTVGNTNSDIAGLGMIYAFVLQAGLSVVLSILSVSLEFYQVSAKSNLRLFGRVESLEKWINCTNSILSNISETQIVNGISLLIAALVQRDELSLYHLHIVYDVVNLTCVSACAALVNVIRAVHFRISVGPHLYLMVFACLYLAYCVLLGRKLSNWDYNVAGKCYDTSRIAASGAPHPLTDHVYLAITCLYMFGSIHSCWLCGQAQELQPTESQHDERADEGGRDDSQSVFPSMLRHQGESALSKTLTTRLFQRYRTIIQVFQEIWENRHKPFQWSLAKKLMKAMSESGMFGQTNLKSSVLLLSLLQFPLHTYMIFSLRYSNEHRLLGDSENTWGFGQIVALVLLGSTLVQSMGTITKYLQKVDSDELPGIVLLQDREQRPAQTA